MINRFFHECPVFRLSELIQSKGEHVSNTASYQLIHYYLKTKRIIRIKKELYAVVPPNETPDSFSVDPYLIAGKASDDSVLAYHTALELYGVAYSSFEQFYFLTQHKIKPFNFAHQYFQPVAWPKKLRMEYTAKQETKTVNRQGINLHITSLERTFVDVLDRIELSGGWEEVLRSLEGIGVLNIDRLIDYTLLLGKAVLNAKVGWCLEQRQGAFAPTEVQIERLLAEKPVTPRYTNKYGESDFKLVKRWNILLPASVIEKIWEEPSHDI